LINAIGVNALIRSLLKFEDTRLRTVCGGLAFSNPLGLGAGFDKNAELIELFSAFGFGHLEIGTVTAKPQPGNERPRIFRFARDHALINRMGFPSHGASVVADRLARSRARDQDLPILGVNIGKSKDTSIDDALRDYEATFHAIAPLADYITINVSSPNTPGLRQLQEKDRLSEIIKGLVTINTRNLPIFVKISPDLEWSALGDVIEVCTLHRLQGIIAVNTTLSRTRLSTPTQEVGGLSGKPLTARAREVVQWIRKNTAADFAIIGVGGVSTVTDLLVLLGAGASLVQVYTSLVFEGPILVRTLLRGLCGAMDKLGISNLSALVDVPAPDLEAIGNV